jgi:hypothetical protein
MTGYALEPVIQFKFLYLIYGEKEQNIYSQNFIEYFIYFVIVYSDDFSYIIIVIIYNCYYIIIK